MIRRVDFKRNIRPDWHSGMDMSRISIGYEVGISQIVSPSISVEELDKEYNQMIDSGMHNIYGDVREQLRLLRAEVYRMAVEASVTGVVSLHGVDEAFKEFETLLDG